MLTTSRFIKQLSIKRRLDRGKKLDAEKKTRLTIGITGCQKSHDRKKPSCKIDLKTESNLLNSMCFPTVTW